MLSVDEIIKNIINYELAKPSGNISLQKGIMGKALFSYWYYGITKDIKYKHYSNNAIDLIYKSINSTNVLRIKDGLMGIASALALSINNNYLKGSIDNVCSEIDDLLYKTISIHIEKLTTSIYAKEYEDFFLDYMIYLTYRLRISLNNKTERELYVNFLIYIFNKVYQSHDLSFYEEPIPASCDYKLAKFFFLLYNMCDLNIEVLRITHILDELKFRLLFKLPYLEYNRLVLLMTLKSMEQTHLLDKEWLAYVSKIEAEVNANKILTELLHDDNLIGEGGFIWLYFTITFFKQNKVIINYDKEKIFRELKSCILKMNDDYIIKASNTNHCLDGCLGVVWSYYYLKGENEKK